jgi:hypothetical protein
MLSPGQLTGAAVEQPPVTAAQFWVSLDMPCSSRANHACYVQTQRPVLDRTIPLEARYMSIAGETMWTWWQTMP